MKRGCAGNDPELCFGPSAPRWPLELESHGSAKMTTLAGPDSVFMMAFFMLLATATYCLPLMHPIQCSSLHVPYPRCVL
jgi:hypothetical protein